MFVKCRRRRRVIKITVVVVFVYTERQQSNFYKTIQIQREKGQWDVYYTGP